MNPTEFLRTSELRASGLRRTEIARAVDSGRLLRVRRGRYLPSHADAEIERVARMGVRLDCVSVLRRHGVFVMDSTRLHVQADPDWSRLPRRPEGIVCHWRSSIAPASRLTTDLLKAVVQACRCQQPRHAIATLDSALHLRLLNSTAVGEVFALLPRRYDALPPLLDSRAESGTESLVRLMLRQLGAAFDVQVRIDGVGRVDFVVDGWLIIECDSESHHGGWDAQRRDRRRDLEAAALGYTTIRPIAEDILYRPEVVQAQLHRVLTTPRLGRAAARPRRRAR